MTYILFDLDGTLLDSQLGIMRCFNHALQQFGKPPCDMAQLAEYIGPPLEFGFSQMLETTDDAIVTRAVAAYRARYRELGLWESELYPGIYDLLEESHGNGKRLKVVTTKPEPFAEQLAAHYAIDRFFDSINGTTFDKSRLDKFDVMRHVVGREAIQPNEAVMIGDRKHDILAAKEHGLATIGVLWGYGSEAELVECQADQVVASVPELISALDRI